MSDKSTILQIQSLSFCYGKKEQKDSYSIFLKDFILKEDDIFAITGVSGCGKSTLLECIAMLRRAQAQTFRLFDRDVLSMSQRELNSLRSAYLGFMPQTGGLIPFLSVLDNLKLQLEVCNSSYYELTKKKHDEKALLDETLALMEQFDLLKYKDEYPDRLSIGQRQRAVFFKTICHNPKLILIDEPTSALDPEHGKLLFETMIKVCKAKGVSCLVVTHDTDLVDSFSLKELSYNPDGKSKGQFLIKDE